MVITLYNVVHYYHFSKGNETLRSTIAIFNAIAIVLAILSVGCGRVLTVCYSAERSDTALLEADHVVSNCTLVLAHCINDAMYVFTFLSHSLRSGDPSQRGRTQ